MSSDAPIVLHVDDDADIREIVLVALETVGGLTVVQCATGHEAIEAASNTPVDLFLLDVMMPKLDGVQTLRRLRDLPGHADTPAFFMTAKVQSGAEAELLKAGAVAVIPKPFDTMTLAKQLVRLWKTD